MSGATHDGWEDSAGGIVPGKTGLAHTGTIVNNKRGNIVIHGWLWGVRAVGAGAGARRERGARAVRVGRACSSLISMKLQGPGGSLILGFIQWWVLTL